MASFDLPLNSRRYSSITSVNSIVLEQQVSLPPPPGKFHPFHKAIFIPDREVWKIVPGSNNKYMISTFGNHRKVPYTKKSTRRGSIVIRGRKVNGVEDGGRKLVGSIYMGIGGPYSVAHLVLFTFVGPRPEGMECCHNDGNWKNNRLENLRWDTHKNNEADKIRHGTTNRKERNGRSKVTKEIVIEMRKLYMTGRYSYSMLHKMFHVCPTEIITGVSWDYPDCYPEGYVIPKRTRAECFKGVNRWKGQGCKDEVCKKHKRDK